MWMAPLGFFEAIWMIAKDVWQGIRGLLAFGFVVILVVILVSGVIGFISLDRDKEKAEMRERLIETVAGLVHAEVKEKAAQMPVRERALFIMETSHNHWMFAHQLTEDDEFGVAAAVLMMCSTEKEREWIKYEVNALRALSAATSGVPVDFDRVLADPPDDSEPIGLLKIWKGMIAAEGLGKTEPDMEKSQ